MSHTISRNAPSLTDGLRTVTNMLHAEFHRQHMSYCHPEAEYPEVDGPHMRISPARPDAHTFWATISTGDEIATRVQVYVIPPRR